MATYSLRKFVLWLGSIVGILIADSDAFRLFLMADVENTS